MPRFTTTDLFIGTAALALIAVPVIAIPILADETSNRVKCAMNLRQIGQALLLYSNENKGRFPRTTYDVEKAGSPTFGTPYESNPALLTETPAPAADPFAKDESPVVRTRTASNDVSAALFLLLRTQDIGSEVFVCPSTGNSKWDFGGANRTAQNHSNFGNRATLAKHLSYSYANPYPSKTATATGYKLNNSLSPDFAVAADINPGGKALLALARKNPSREMQAGNSLNHFREGQNILFGDGRVEFQQNPFAGIDRDNIYTFGPHDRKATDPAANPAVGINGSPSDANDSILLPTSEDLGVTGYSTQVRNPEFSPLPPEKAAELLKSLSREFTTRQAGTPAMQIVEPRASTSLKFSDKTLRVTRGPMTITWTCDIGFFPGDPNYYLVQLNAPETKTTYVTLEAKPNELNFAGNPLLEGNWIPTSSEGAKATSAMEEQTRKLLAGNYALNADPRIYRNIPAIAPFAAGGVNGAWTLALSADKAVFSSGPLSLTYTYRVIPQGAVTVLMLYTDNGPTGSFQLTGITPPTLTSREWGGPWTKQ